VVLSGVPLLLYFGYCEGWWGRQSLLLQYLFQCDCPAASSQARYPKEVDVILPGCIKRGVILSPGGRLLYVREQNKEHISTYLLDLKTEEKTSFFLSETGGFSFLADDLLYIWLSYLQDMYILDRATGEQYPVSRFTSLYPEANEDGYANLSLLAEELQKAKYVFLIQQDRTVIALGSDFPASSSQNFLTGWFDIPGFETDRVEQFLQSNNIVHQTVPLYAPEEAISPNGRFIARYDGIYLAATNQKIVEGYQFSRNYHSYGGQYLSLRGWKYDSSGAIYAQSFGPCVLEIPGLDAPGCIWEVPEPVILLKMPEDYLLSESK
jgi:hypothetical protein